MVYIFLADGFETVEALAVVDMLRRAQIPVETVSITDRKMVTSAQKITVQADQTLDAVTDAPAQMYVLPGGIPGTPNLKNCDTLMKMLEKQYETGGYLAAICAAPSIFAEKGWLQGKRTIAYPDYEAMLEENGAQVVKQPAVTDGKIITGRGMGTAIAFASAIISALKDPETAQDVETKIVYK